MSEEFSRFKKFIWASGLELEPSQLEELYYLEDESKVPVFRSFRHRVKVPATYENMAMIVVSRIRKFGLEATLAFVRQHSFNSPEFAEQLEGYREIQNKKLFYLTQFEARPRGVKGLGKCFKCGNEELIVSQKQMNAADEATATFYGCINCGAQWRV